MKYYHALRVEMIKAHLTEFTEAQSFQNLDSKILNKGLLSAQLRQTAFNLRPSAANSDLDF
jgi:hypothetical protein